MKKSTYEAFINHLIDYRGIKDEKLKSLYESAFRTAFNITEVECLVKLANDEKMKDKSSITKYIETLLAIVNDNIIGDDDLNLFIDKYCPPTITYDVRYEFINLIDKSAINDENIEVIGNLIYVIGAIEPFYNKNVKTVDELIYQRVEDYVTKNSSWEHIDNILLIIKDALKHSSQENLYSYIEDVKKYIITSLSNCLTYDTLKHLGVKSETYNDSGIYDKVYSLIENEKSYIEPILSLLESNIKTFLECPQFTNKLIAQNGTLTREYEFSMSVYDDKENTTLQFKTTFDDICELALMAWEEDDSYINIFHKYITMNPTVIGCRTEEEILNAFDGFIESKFNEYIDENGQYIDEEKFIDDIKKALNGNPLYVNDKFSFVDEDLEKTYKVELFIK